MLTRDEEKAPESSNTEHQWSIVSPMFQPTDLSSSLSSLSSTVPTPVPSPSETTLSSSSSSTGAPAAPASTPQASPGTTPPMATRGLGFYNSVSGVSKLSVPGTNLIGTAACPSPASPLSPLSPLSPKK
jgi:hypothetical protein